MEEFSEPGGGGGGYTTGCLGAVLRPLVSPGLCEQKAQAKLWNRDQKKYTVHKSDYDLHKVVLLI